MKKYTILLALLVIGLLVLSLPASAQTIADLQAQIDALLKQVQALQAQLGEQGTAPAPAPTPPAGTAPPAPPTNVAACLSMSYNLYLGLNNAETEGEVTKLQKYLAADASVYPEGLITGFFGPLTEQAVKRFQAKNNIVSSGSPDTTGYGVVGQKTRVAISSECSSSAPAVTVPGITAPQLISPVAGAMLDNGRTDRQDNIIWDFDWSDVPGASTYHLYVIGDTASFPAIDNKNLSQSSYHHVSPGAYITDNNRFNWTWKVRALVNGTWGGWSEVRGFDVERVDSDPISATSSPLLTVTYPKGGEEFEVGSTQYFHWNWNSDTESRVRTHWVRYNADKSFEELNDEFGNAIARKGDNWMNLTIPDYPTDGEYYFRVCDSYFAAGTFECDENDRPFKLFKKTATTSTTTESRLTLLSPNGGEKWQTGSTQTIQWTSKNYNSSEPVEIELRRNFVGVNSYANDKFVLNIATGAPNTGSFYWSIPKNLDEANDYLIVISCGAGSTYSNEGCVADRNDALFGIVVSTADAKADLKPTPITYTDTNNDGIFAGESIFFDTGIQNIGDKGTGIFNVKWFVDGAQKGYGSHEGIQAKQTIYGGNSQYAWTATEGTHTIRFVVDADNHVSESNEGNNATEITVTIKPQNTASNSAPTMVYPQNGQTLDLEGGYMFKVNQVAGASGYLYGFFQDGRMVYENYRDDRELSSSGEFAIWQDNPSHPLSSVQPAPPRYKIHSGNLEVWIRALVNDQWTDARIITITLKPREQSTTPTSTLNLLGSALDTLKEMERILRDMLLRP